MPSLIDIRRRIRAVKSTQQITKAMKMVSAAKLRRAQENILNARPYVLQAMRVLNSLASRVDQQAHPLLEVRPDQAGRPMLLIVVTADKGLCGSFNTNIIKHAGRLIAEEPERQISLGLVGRKGRDFFGRRGFPVQFELIHLFAHLKFTHAEQIAHAAIHAYTDKKVDSVRIVYNEFKSILQQRVIDEQLLPIPRLEGFDRLADAARVDYIYEPSPQEIFKSLLPRVVEFQINRALLESAAAEHAARMTAMDSATKNSAEIIEQQTLYLNKLRQAAITREIIEVVSGAEAL
jgi:F-type H+-transporting ATPase subunit gamma